MVFSWYHGPLEDVLMVFAKRYFSLVQILSICPIFIFIYFKLLVLKERVSLKAGPPDFATIKRFFFSCRWKGFHTNVWDVFITFQFFNFAVQWDVKIKFLAISPENNDSDRIEKEFVERHCTSTNGRSQKFHVELWQMVTATLNMFA